ncbi:unnamed protein product [Chilo suppressalis]|uniref:Uncharacterized protein n=1 Tax=Chilo suppressalis TaxID=168631 RepID=A0ABN8E9R0_CHISP|nr:unnamed protein product [Chilo suppressalis]
MTASNVPYDTMSMTSRLGPLFTKCCCCIPLRIGCFILGYLNLVFNAFHMLALLALTTYIGLTTHGFDHYDPEDLRFINSNPSTVESYERPFLNQIGLLLLVILSVNLVWLVINIACLVGLHKRRPGPVRLYVAFATARLLLTLAGFVYLVMTASSNIQAVVSNSIDMVLTVYFVVVYYMCALQMERERDEGREIKKLPVGDISFIYSANIDKQSLVA